MTHLFREVDVILQPDWILRRVRLDLNLRHLIVFRPATIDLILTKMARDTNSDGALGWAPDFPAEHADYVAVEFLRSCPPAARKAAQKSLLHTLTERAPKWTADLQRVTDLALRE